MAKQVISDIVAAEQEASAIVSKAQAAARETVLHAQEDSMRMMDERITEAKRKAKELILQKKNLLDTQTALIKQKNQMNDDEFLKETELKMEDAADFIAERILL